MRRNISANIVSISSMRIAEVREEEVVVVMLAVVQEDDVKSSGCRADPSIFLRTTIARGESSPSVIHRDLITARTETRARLDVAFFPLAIIATMLSYFNVLTLVVRRLQKWHINAIIELALFHKPSGVFNDICVI